MSKRYEANLKSFQYKNPRASALLSCSIVDHVQSVQTSGEQNLVNKKYPGSYYHSPNGTMKEAQEWANTLNLKDVQVVLIFGIGLGYCYKALASWLEQNPQHHVIFLEDDLAVIDAFLHTEIAKEFFDNRQASLYFIEDSHEGVEILRSIIWGVFPDKMEITSLPFYEKMRKEVLSRLKKD